MCIAMFLTGSRTPIMSTDARLTSNAQGMNLIEASNQLGKEHTPTNMIYLTDETKDNNTLWEYYSTRAWEL